MRYMTHLPQTVRQWQTPWAVLRTKSAVAGLSLSRKSALICSKRLRNVRMPTVQGVKVYKSESDDELLMITMLQGLPALSFKLRRRTNSSMKQLERFPRDSY